MHVNTWTRVWRNRPAYLLRLNGVALALSFAGCASGIQSNADVHSILHLITTYALSIDRADTALADQIWSNAPEVSFIHPRGEEHGRTQIETDVYRDLMGATFSERKLTPKDISVHVYGEAAWSQFNWDFVAKVRANGAPIHTQGRETQIYRRENGQWRIVHVHYSGAPVAGNLKGF